MTTTENGNWTQTPSDLSNADDNDLTTFTTRGYVLSSNSSNQQEFVKDFGSVISSNVDVKYQTRQNGAGSDQTVYTISKSTNGTSWTPVSNFILTTNDTYQDRTDLVSGHSFRYLKIQMNRSNTGRFASLRMFAWKVAVINQRLKVWFYPSGNVQSGSTAQQLKVWFYPDNNVQAGTGGGTSSSAFKWWIGMRGKRRYGNKAIKRISL